LVDGGVGCTDRFDTVATEVVRRMFHMLLGAPQRRDRFLDLRMRLAGRWGLRRLRAACRRRNCLSG
jgi:hypothetical protein